MRFFGFRLGEPATAKSLAVGADAARDRRAWGTAARRYQGSLALDPSRTDLWVQLGHALKENGDMSGAAAAYQHAIDQVPEAADTHLQLGHLFKMQQQWAQAAEAYANAARLDPSLADPVRELRELIEAGVPLDDPDLVTAVLGRERRKQRLAAHETPRKRSRAKPSAMDAVGRKEPLRRSRPSPLARRRPRLPLMHPEPAPPASHEAEQIEAHEPPPSPPPAPPASEPQRYFPLSEGVGLTRLLDGHFLYVDPMDEAVASHLIARGYWESWIHRVVCDLVQPGDHIIEVGANFGVYTVALAQGCGPDGSVLSFEANPMLASLVDRSVRFNGYGGRVQVIGKAAADKPGRLSFAVSRRNAGGGTLSMTQGALGADSALIDVEAVRLDDVVERSVRFIRMDAEGSEPLILRGAERLLRRPDIVLCMEWDIVQMGARVDLDQFVAWLAGMKFRFWRIQFDSLLLEVPGAAMATLSACDVVVSRSPPPGVEIAAPSSGAAD